MIAFGLVERGVRTYCVARDRTKLEALQNELSRLGEGVGIAADISTAAGRDQIASSLRERESSLHILVNNAGLLNVTPFDGVTEESWDAEYDTNIKALFFLSKTLIGLLRAGASPERHAAIVNIGSIGGVRIRPPPTFAYQSSKAAVHHLTRGMARHLGAEHITVNAIAPGTFPSSMMPVRAGSPEYEGLIKTIPCRRLGAPGDIVGAVVFLASSAGGYVNGAVLNLDGGLSL